MEGPGVVYRAVGVFVDCVTSGACCYNDVDDDASAAVWIKPEEEEGATCTGVLWYVTPVNIIIIMHVYIYK